jgi:protein phosphatase
MTVTLDTWGFSLGKGPVNEDAYFLDPARLVFGVFDGLGATSQAALAARLAAGAIQAAYATGGPADDLRAEREFLTLAVDGAGALIASTLQDGLTTASVVKVCEDEGDDGRAVALVCNIGDSRVYRYTRGRLVQCTLDDSMFGVRWEVQLALSEAVVPSGLLERRYFDLRHVLDRCLGHQGDTAHLWQTGATDGDLLVAMTDGVTDNLTFSEVGRVLHDGRGHPELAARRLVGAAHRRSRQTEHARAKVDDITAVVARVGVGPPG